MFRHWATVIAGLSVLLIAGSAQSSGCCDEAPRWLLQNSVFTGFDNNIVAVPGNDSRVNLVLLMADQTGATLRAAPAVPDAAAANVSPPLPLFKWNAFKASIVAEPSAPGGDRFARGSRCDSNAGGTTAFEAALARDPKLSAAETAALVAMRRAMQPNCDNGEGNPSLGAATGGLSDAARPYATYLQGAQSFYGGNFDAATALFASLGNARTAWLKETALYMVARSAVNRAQVSAFDDYGGLAEPGTRDLTPVMASQRAITDYLRAYPAGAYAVSARGLVRRTYWLAGDRRRLAEEYRKLFAIRDSALRGIDYFTLAEEIDQKLSLGPTDVDVADPVFLAVADLMAMRGPGLYADEGAAKPITIAQIEAQRARFAGNKPLYDYVVAAHAYFVAKRPADVLRLIPDATRQGRFGTLEFSRQMLRGFALDAVRDVNSRGFWLQMIGGATQAYQRQAVELALAMHDERSSGGLARVFAPDSPVKDVGIRGILLGYAAGPDILRQQATRAGVGKAERDTALFALLIKQLGRGMYAGFLGDLRLVRPGASAQSGNFSAINFREERYGEAGEAPLGLFTAPGGYGDFGCPALRSVVAQLAKNPRASKPLLCVGEFMRVSGFDHFVLDMPPPRDELGGAPSLFPGKPYSRLESYKSVIADAGAPADDKAYALYRAVNCYAPAGSNDCGGVEVDKAQRRAWFQRLKRDYPQTSWAKSLAFYW
jgi:hypothetical protein